MFLSFLNLPSDIAIRSPLSFGELSRHSQSVGSSSQSRLVHLSRRRAVSRNNSRPRGSAVIGVVKFVAGDIS
jgi:hypothetical protein